MGGTQSRVSAVFTALNDLLGAVGAAALCEPTALAKWARRDFVPYVLMGRDEWQVRCRGQAYSVKVADNERWRR